MWESLIQSNLMCCRWHMHVALEINGLAVRTRLGYSCLWYPCSSHFLHMAQRVRLWTLWPEGWPQGWPWLIRSGFLECSGKKVPKAAFGSAGKNVWIGSHVCRGSQIQWWCPGCVILVTSAANVQNLHWLIMIPFLRTLLFNGVEDRSACL